MRVVLCDLENSTGFVQIRCNERTCWIFCYDESHASGGNEHPLSCQKSKCTKTISQIKYEMSERKWLGRLNIDCRFCLCHRSTACTCFAAGSAGIQSVFIPYGIMILHLSQMVYVYFKISHSKFCGTRFFLVWCIEKCKFWKRNDTTAKQKTEIYLFFERDHTERALSMKIQNPIVSSCIL